MYKKLFVFLPFLTWVSCCYAQNQFIKPNNKNLSYDGRVMLKVDSAGLSWTGNAVKLNFKGTGVKALLKDEHSKNYLKVILDGKVMPDIQPDSMKHLYTLASGLTDTDHTLIIFKRTEWVFGKTWFYGFDLGDNGTVLSAPKYKRRIEFYGNSITCGHGVIDSSGKDRGTPEFQDGYLTYAAITARHFNAQFSCIARSGIGIMISWFPQVMPELYDRLDPDDASSKWDFTKDVPQVVVINLFQNDSWLVNRPDHEQFKPKFGTTPPTKKQIIDAYKSFISKIRSKYPDANIICALGNMDITRQGSPWPGYVQKAVTELNDKKITAHFFPYKNSPGHPRVAEQQAMANDLIGYIDKNIRW